MDQILYESECNSQCVCIHMYVRLTMHLHTCRYILDLTKDQKAQFVAMSTEMASGARLKVGVHLLHGTSCWFNNSHTFSTVDTHLLPWHCRFIMDYYFYS